MTNTGSLPTIWSCQTRIDALPAYGWNETLWQPRPTIYKAKVQLADMDRNCYSDHDVMIARHPSETDERMLIRLLAFALNVPTDDECGPLEFARDMWDADEPALWQKDLTGKILHWIEIGQPEDRRLMQASSRSERVSAYCFSSSWAQWWRGIATKITRARNLTIWQVPSNQSQALGALANRSMKLEVTVQEGTIWVGDSTSSVEVSLVRLFGDVESAKP